MLGADAGCERQPVAKGILDRHIPGAPRHGFNSRPSVLVMSRAQFAVKGIQAVRLNPHRRATFNLRNEMRPQLWRAEERFVPDCTRVVSGRRLLGSGWPLNLIRQCDGSVERRIVHTGLAPN